MALTSFQKHYIKKNIARSSVKQLSLDLSIPEHLINNYLRKKASLQKYVGSSGQASSSGSASSFVENKTNFNFKSFLSDNLNIFIFLFILVSAVYYNSLGNSFVSDDIAGVLNNKDLNNFSYVFSTIGGSFQRLVWFLTLKIGGLNPTYFRVINILFHLGSTWLVFTLLSLITRKNIAFFSAVIFAVHPILIESVAWISGAPYSYSGFFFLASFLFYILYRKKNNKKYYIFSIIFLFLMLNANQKSVTLFGAIFLYELAFGNLRMDWKKILPYFISCVIFGITLLIQIGQRVTSVGAVSYTDNTGFYNPFVQIPTALANYFKLLFWPDTLSLYQTEMSFTNIQFFFMAIITLIYFGIIFYGWKKNRFLFFWLSFLPIALIPTLTPYKIAWVVAERYVYLGSLGIFIAVAMLFDWLIRKSEGKNIQYKYATYSVFAIIIVALSVRSIVRNVDWKNEDNLWVATARVASSGPNIHNNMGDVYARHGDYEKAAEEFKKATEINPNYGDAYHNLANTYKAMGKNDLAIQYYEKALSINPNIWQSYQNLAAIYFEQGDSLKALDYMKKALKVNPDNPDLQQNMAMVESSLNSK